METGKNRRKLITLAATAIFSAIVVVLQITLGLITVGTVNLNFTLIPILLAGMLFGPVSGTITGTAFGITTFIQCVDGTQVFGAALFGINWFYCFVMCVVRGALVGLLAALIYKAMSRAVKRPYVCALVASCCAPVINTGIFLAGYALLYNGHMHSLMSAEKAGAIYILFILLAGINFVFEFATSALLTPPATAALTKSLNPKLKVNED